jgi:alpha-L-fucosidase
MKIFSPMLSFAALLTGSLALAVSAQETKPAVQLHLPMAPGPFQPTMDSLTNYSYPDWFRDAKFGIWAHWGPQAVPMDGDWYARGMYEPGNKHYTYHTNHYGHPSEFGYKDIIPLWKAEKWDPDRLMQLYKKAGAKYFVSMGSHHDNFFLWNSKLHRWNAVNMGPKRDVVGEWQKAAQKYGLKFGVSEHLGASFTWFQSSHRADKTGPKAGVPYDGADPKWQDLYHFPAEPGDTGWYSNNPRWQQQWYNEIKELVDNYHPDLLYSDGGVPFGNQAGLSMIAHLYNSNIQNRNRKSLDPLSCKGAELLCNINHMRSSTPQVIYNCKQKSEGRWVEDLERGIMPKIDPYPWQTDTSIGDWFYDRNWKFRPVSWVIHMLVDNVSKNGNLLLNIVQRPDGSLDPEVETMLQQLAAWNAIHGEAIFGTRPWLVYGESGVKVKGGNFNEDFKYNAKEIRFTTKGKTLYAIALGWPEDGRLVVRSLARPAGENVNHITGVSLLGHNGKIEWKQTADGLVVTLPSQRVSEFTTALKITGTGLRNIPFTKAEPALTVNGNGDLELGADDAELHGDGIKTEDHGGQSNIGFWDNVNDWATWRVRIRQAGAFKVSASLASISGASEFVMEVDGQRISGKADQTAGWDQFKEVGLGKIEIKHPGEQVVKIRPKDAAHWHAMNLRFVKLTKTE